MYRVPREKRKKCEPPSRMGVWVGVSRKTRDGHSVVPIQWCALEQCFRLGATVECVTVNSMYMIMCTLSGWSLLMVSLVHRILMILLTH